jgi:secreted trypsin-like serine protease
LGRARRAVAAALVTCAAGAAGAVRPAQAEPITPLIVNGEIAGIADHPYYAQVFSYSATSGSFCGGSIVAARIVLTAAHCARGFTRFEVRVGSDLFLGGQRVDVLRATIHPAYEPATARNDLALLHLAAPVANRISVIGPASDYRWLGDGHDLTVIGMGCTEPLRSDCTGPSDDLRRATVRSRSDAACDSELAVFGGIDARTMLCAGQLSDPFGSRNAPNACFGDSGGPLVVAGHDGRPRLVGAVSWGGATCGDYPVVYARLANFRAWLRSNGVPIERMPFRRGPAVNVGITATPIVGDFNGDGRDDVIWYRPGPSGDQLKFGSPTGGFVTGPPINIDGVFVPTPGDFNGDDIDDVFWYRPGIAADSIWLGRTSGLFRSGPAIDIDGIFAPVAGDFNGDGRDDVLLYGASSSPDQLRLGTPLGRLGSGPPTVVAGIFAVGVPGDYTGDGIDDIAWYAPGSDPDLVRRGSPTGEFRSGPPLTMGGAFRPLGGDFNGDGRADLLWFDGFGEDLLRDMGANRFVVGPEVRVDGAFEPFTGDFNGDEVDDVFWYRPGPAGDTMWLGIAA